MKAWLNAIGAATPFAEGWLNLRAAFDLSGAPVFEQNWTPVLEGINPRQLRRLSLSTRTALAASLELLDVLGQDAAWVFASSLGEGETLHVILDALCDEEIMLQPLRFQNAVHNAASGQLTILKGLKGPVTSIAAFDQTAPAGLLKAIVQCSREETPVGSVIYDAPIPTPLHSKRPLGFAAAIGFALSPQQTSRSIASLSIGPFGTAPTQPNTALGKLFQHSGNPVHLAVLLLETLARHGSAVSLGPTLSLDINYV